MNEGKDKCEVLKQIRKEIAEKYGIDYTPTECTFDGECSGMCPKCQQETDDIWAAIKEKEHPNV